MRKFGISLLILSILLFFAGVYGFTTRISSSFVSELTKYCFMSWFLVAIAGFVLIQIAKDIDAKKR